MQEIVKNLLSNAQGLWITFCAFMGINTTSILVLVISLLKSKAKKEYTKGAIDRFLAEQDIKLNESIDKKIDAACSKFENSTNKMADRVYNKLKISDEQKQQALETEASKVEDIIKNITENLK